MSPKKLHIKTFGCQMNAYDSERMAEALEPAGFELTEAMDEADLVILNTCHIREKAAEKVYSELGRVRLTKEARKAHGRDTMVAVAGCVAQAEGEEIIARAPVVDIVVGPQSLHRLADLVAIASTGKRSIETEFPAQDKFAALPQRATGKRQTSAFVTVQEGCDKFCSFCVVPYTRGEEVSRPMDDVLTEVAELAEQGVKEVTLLGQVFVKAEDGKQTIEQLLKAKGASVNGFALYVVGEGIEKKQSDFAAEVAAAAATRG